MARQAWIQGMYVGSTELWRQDMREPQTSHNRTHCSVGSMYAAFAHQETKAIYKCIQRASEDETETSQPSQAQVGFCDVASPLRHSFC